MADLHPIENWRPVVGYEGCYEVSDLGRVRSLTRVTTNGHRVVGRIRRPTMDRKGYLRHHVGQHTFRVHRLVLEAFIGPRPDGQECCHNDGDKMNNRLGNLRWDTRDSNKSDRLKHSHSSSTPLNDDLVKQIIVLLRSGTGQTEIAKRFGIHQGAVSSILHRKSWKHINVN